MGSRPLLYVCVRPQRDAAAGEYASFRAATGLDTTRLHRWDLVDEALPGDVADRYAGVLVGGSPFNVTDEERSPVQRRVEDDLEALAATAAASGIAALYTCYGVGVVTRMLGGAVTAEYPEPTGAATVTLTAAGTDDPVFGVLPPSFEAFTAHKEGAGAPPPGSTLLATGTLCPVQAYRVGEHLYTTQFHPEPTPRDFTERMAVYRSAGYFDPDEFDEVSARVLASAVTEPARMLRRFAERFGPA